MVVSNQFQLLQELDLARVPESGQIDEHPDGHFLQEKEMVVVGHTIIRGVDSIVCAWRKGFSHNSNIPNSNIEIFGNYLGEITAEMKQGNAFVCGDFSSKIFKKTL